MLHSKVATIVPFHHLNLIEYDSYMLALSHAAEAVEYLSFFRDQSRNGSHVILDNSAVELGEPEPFGRYLEKALEMEAHEILLPDHFRDPSATLGAAEYALRVLTETDVYSGKIMAVPQGNSVVSWLRNAADLLGLRAITDDGDRLYKVNTVGISCRYTDMFDGNRWNAAVLLLQGILRYQQDVNIHFLGCYADPREEIAPALNSIRVNGVDSSYPSVYAQNGIRLTKEMFAMPRPPREINFLADQYDVGLLRTNVNEWRNACLNLI